MMMMLMMMIMRFYVIICRRLISIGTRIALSAAAAIADWERSVAIKGWKYWGHQNSQFSRGGRTGGTKTPKICHPGDNFEQWRSWGS